LQIEKGFRRKGLGRFMMKVLELLAIKADMLKIMATIFKNDKPEVSLCSLLFSTVGKRERDRNFFLKS
jgi:hypothetical protein